MRMLRWHQIAITLMYTWFRRQVYSQGRKLEIRWWRAVESTARRRVIDVCKYGPKHEAHSSSKNNSCSNIDPISRVQAHLAPQDDPSVSYKVTGRGGDRWDAILRLRVRRCEKDSWRRSDITGSTGAGSNWHEADAVG